MSLGDNEKDSPMADIAQFNWHTIRRKRRDNEKDSPMADIV
jgi:hypothetical protein